MKTQQRTKSERHNIFAGEVNKIALSSNDDKRIQSIDSIETYAYGTIQDMINFDDVIKEETKEHNPNWPEILDHS